MSLSNQKNCQCVENNNPFFLLPDETKARLENLYLRLITSYENRIQALEIRLQELEKKLLQAEEQYKNTIERKALEIICNENPICIY